MAKKSFTKRFKVTKTGKVLRRKQGLSHSKANKSRKVKMRKKDLKRISRVDRPNITEHLEVEGVE